MTKVDIIWHCLNIKINCCLESFFFKAMLCFYPSLKLFLDSLNWIIHFGLASTRFNLKLELNKKPSWQISRFNCLIGSNDAAKKISKLVTFFFKFSKSIIRLLAEHGRIYYYIIYYFSFYNSKELQTRKHKINWKKDEVDSLK